MKCLYISLIPLSLLAFIFLVVALVSNHWVTITKCWSAGNTAATSTIEYNQGLFQKCTSGTCTNLMEGPPEKLAIIPGSFCSNKGNSWYVKDADCVEYYKCENGLELEKGTCTGSQQFDLYTQKCSSTKPKCGCNDFKCKAANGPDALKKISDDLCGGWEQCKTDATTNTLVYSSGTCPSGEFFDASAGQQKCVTVKPGSCKDKECVSGGKAISSLVMTDKPVCENYYKCVNGKKQAAVKCNAGETALLASGNCITKTNTQPSADRATCQNPKCKADSKSKRVNALDCQNYYSCSSKLITYSTCTGTSTTGTPYFDEAKQACVDHANKPADCKAIECIARADGYKIIPGDTDCLAWTRCSNGGKTYTTSTTTTQCAAGTTINVNGGGTPPCEATQQTYCKNPKCKNLAAGWHLITTPDATACKKYFQCGAGETLIKAEDTCLGNTVFVKTAGVCQGSTASGSTTCWDPRCTALDGTHKKTLTDYSNPNQINGRVECQKYWECKNGFRTDKDCGAGSFYDKANTQCTSTRPSNCQDVRCVNKADRKYGTDGADCITWKECTNQLQTATGSCPVTGGTQTMFNSVTGVCDDPSKTAMPFGCKAKVTPVDGGWSPWTLYGACSVNYTYNAKAEVGSTMRTRSCTCPSKQGTGADCPGNSYEVSFCHKCSPEKGWLMGARAGLALSMACSIMTLLWACWCCYSMKCYACHAVIFHTCVSVIAGLVGAIMANGNKPDLGYTCEVASGWGFIMAILGVIVTIITHIIAIVIAVKGRNRVQSADCSEMKEKKCKSKDKSKVSSTGVADDTRTNSQQNLHNNRTSQQHESSNETYQA